MSIQDTFFAIPFTPREVNLGDGVPDINLTKWFSAEEPVIMSAGATVSTDNEEVKGYYGTTKGAQKILTKRRQCTLRMKANSEILPLLLGSMSGAVNTTDLGGPGPFEHKFPYPAEDGCTKTPYTFSIVCATDRCEPTTHRKHNGVVCTEISIEVERNGDVMLTATLVADGSDEDASAFTPPAVGTAIFGHRFRFNDLTLLMGPLGTENISNLFRSLTISANSNMQEEYNAERGELIGEYVKGGAPTLEVSLVVDGTVGDTLWGYWRNQDYLILDARFDNPDDAAHFLQIKAPAAVVNPDAGDFYGWDNGIREILTLPLMFHLDPAVAPADGMLQLWTVGNAEGVYLGV